MGVRTRTQNRSIPPCRLVAWTSPRFAWSVEVRAGNWTFASPPVVPPLCVRSSRASGHPCTHKGLTSHQLHITLYIIIYISAVNAYQHAYQNVQKTPSGRTELCRICFFLFFGVFGVFLQIQHFSNSPTWQNISKTQAFSHATNTTKFQRRAMSSNF